MEQLGKFMFNIRAEKSLTYRNEEGPGSDKRDGGGEGSVLLAQVA